MTQGDIVILNFPFTDLSGQKIRPAVIVSNRNYNSNKNLILVGIYGAEKQNSLVLENTDLEIKNLKKTSFINFENIFTLEKSLVLKKVDRLNDKKLGETLERLKSCF